MSPRLGFLLPLPLLSSVLDVRHAPRALPQAAKDAEGEANKLRLELIALKTRMDGSGTGSDVVVSPEDGRHTPLQPSKERDTLEPDLAAFLRKARINGPPASNETCSNSRRV